MMSTRGAQQGPCLRLPQPGACQVVEKYTCTNTPRQIASTGCTSIAAAWLFIFQGTFGALGHGDEENRDAPVLVNPLWAAGIVMVS